MNMRISDLSSGNRIEGTTCTPTKLDKTQVDEFLFRFVEDTKDNRIKIYQSKTDPEGRKYAMGIIGSEKFIYEERPGFPPKLTITNLDGVQTTIENPQRYHILDPFLQKLEKQLDITGSSSQQITGKEFQCTPTELNKKQFDEIVSQFEKDTKGKEIMISESETSSRGNKYARGVIGDYSFEYNKAPRHDTGFNTKLTLIDRDGKATTIDNPEQHPGLKSFLNNLNQAIQDNPNNVDLILRYSCQFTGRF